RPRAPCARWSTGSTRSARSSSPSTSSTAWPRSAAWPRSRPTWPAPRLTPTCCARSVDWSRRAGAPGPAGPPSASAPNRPMPADARLLVGPGDTVEANELIASCHDADGAAHEVVAAGRLLGVADPRPHLVVDAGARVAAGQVVARRATLFGLVRREVRAP